MLLVTPLAAPATLLRPAPRLLAGRAPRGGRPADVPRRVRRGVVPEPRASASSTGSRRSSRPRSRRSRSTPAGGRCTWSAGASAASSRCSRPPTGRDLPIASITVVGLAGRRRRQVPLVAPLRPLLNLDRRAGLLTPVYQLMGGAPKPLVKWAFQLSSIQKLVTKPLAVADPPRRRRLPRPDRGGRPVHREHDRLPRPQLRAALPPLRAQQRAQHRPSSSATAPSSSPRSRPVAGLRRRHRRHRAGQRGQGRACRCSAARAEVRFEIVPGGHLGMLTGRAARGSTWRVLDEWVGAVVDADVTRRGPRRSGREEGPGKKAPAKKPAGTALKKARPSGRRRRARRRPEPTPRRRDPARCADALGAS